MIEDRDAHFLEMKISGLGIKIQISGDTNNKKHAEYLLQALKEIHKCAKHPNGLIKEIE